MPSVRSHGTAPGFVAFPPLLMVVGGIVLVALGKWLSRNDAAWLSAVIGGALGGPSASAEANSTGNEGSVPAPLKVASVLVGASSEGNAGRGVRSFASGLWVRARAKSLANSLDDVIINGYSRVC